MKRSEFLKRLGIGAVAAVAAPALFISKGDQGLNGTGANIFESKNRWKRHESFHLIEGQNYRVSFDYINYKDDPFSVTVDNQGVFHIDQKNIPKGESISITDISLKQMGNGFRNMQSVENYILSRARI